MKAAKNIRLAVIDHGLFLPLALKLGEQVDHVYYHTPCEEAFATVKQCSVGDGFIGQNVERVDDIWDCREQADAYVFPDIGFAAEQKELIRQGYPVWGSRDGDSLEIYRGKFLRTLEQLDMPVAPCAAIQGVTNLKLFLRDKEDKYIKISRYRGDIETEHWRDWRQDEGLLDYWAFKLGPKRERMVFYVMDPIEAEVEDGTDAYCIDGQWPALCIHGMEKKDKGYIGTFQKFSGLPDEMKMPNERFGPVLAQFGYRNFFSTEIRITNEGVPYFIDPTCRMGSPPSQVMVEMIGNLADVIWQGANGECIDPEPAATFGVQSLLHLKGDKSQWGQAAIPASIRQWVKCGSCSQDGGNLSFAPDKGGDDVGWLVAVGDTIVEAIQNLQKHEKELPAGMHADTHCLADLLKEIRTAEEAGMEFTPQDVPEPAVVLEDA